MARHNGLSFCYAKSCGFAASCCADGAEHAIEQLEDMLKEAGGESEHMAIKKAISVLKNA